MALTSKKYSAVHGKTGSDKSKLQANFDDGHIHTLTDLADNGTNPEFGALIYQIQEMQDELDYLRTEISSNKDKISMEIGSKATQAMAGNTTLLALGTSSTTALAGDTNIVTIGSSTTIAFGDMVTVPGKKGAKTTYNIVMTVTNGGVSKAITLTLT